MTTQHTNKAIVRDYVAAMNAGDAAKLKTLFRPDAEIYGVLRKGNLDHALPIWKQLHDALSMQLEICDMIAEGDVVGVRFKETGKSVAPFGNFPATGNSFELTAIEWFTLRDGRIISRHGVRDSASQARQLGWMK